jgi:short-subunit dehydrogenase
MSFQNKVVWITGASSGIGEGMVHAFAKAGAKVVLSARREDELIRVKNEANLSEENALVLPFDVEKHEQAEAKVAQIMQKFGRIDVLMNNAGISSRGMVMDNTMEVYRRIFELNVFSVIAITRAVLPIMIAQKSGHITATSSIAGKIGTPMRSAYAATKHALHGFFDSLRSEVYKENVAITLICPGYIKTNISVNALNGSGSQYGKMDENQIKGMSPEECANKILKGMANGKQELYIGGKEVMGVYLKRFFPRILSKMVRNVNMKTV